MSGICVEIRWHKSIIHTINFEMSRSPVKFGKLSGIVEEQLNDSTIRTVKGSDNGSLLSIDELTEQEWFERFNTIES